MAIRVLNYLTAFYLDYITTQRAAKQHIRKLPAIFPIVLYNGCAFCQTAQISGSISA
ncbi:MAG: hypothetical protein DYG89_41595 [Caldilinea sp. CFX5]|nr:hypothetical protein [Caldilinea sp. CFX5]